jgi:purine-binding chemotaxis protein CheW
VLSAGGIDGRGAAGGAGALPGRGALRLVRCEVGGASFCLDPARVRSIRRSDQLEPTPPPGSPGPPGAANAAGGRPLGWLPDEGGPIAVYSLAARLGASLLPPRAAGPVIVLDAGPEPWGLMVDRVSRTAEVAPAARLPLPPLARDPARGWFDGVAALPDRLALVLAADRLHPAARAARTAEGVEGAAADGGAGAEAGPSPPEGAPDPTAAPSPSAAGANGGPGRIVLFSTSPGGEAPVLFALTLAQVQEIARPQPLTRVPGAPPYLLGLARWRDEAVPVIDLSLRLGGGPSFFEGESRLLIARGARVPRRLGFPVRTEIRALALPLPNRPSRQRRLLDRSLVRGIFELDAGTVFVPDLDRFLAGP